MTQTWKIILKVLRILAGSVLLLVGLSGLVLPFLPGWALIIPGVLILAKDVPFFSRLLLWVITCRMVYWLETRFPRIQGPLHRLRERLRHSQHARAALPLIDCNPKDEEKREVA